MFLSPDKNSFIRRLKRRSREVFLPDPGAISAVKKQTGSDLKRISRVPKLCDESSVAPSHHALQYFHHLPVLLHQSSCETPARMETRRRGGEVGGKGRRFSREEAQEEKGSHGGAGKGAELSRPAQQVRDHSSLPGRTAPGVPSERSAARHLLQSVALAGSSVPP